ncbi:unnamed protein product [Didymodactylos carnosus]|uniref:6-phosphogluconolactonase n=1 Tax=Didymodactylos carnosus TaxID=1234261 RepID=A0A814P610_9BILA|nr:unnamed protein product [Didymodactylos carnosus]CAF3864485.1 unnamed protein product [Didymodactylos carnosus]
MLGLNNLVSSCTNSVTSNFPSESIHITDLLKTMATSNFVVSDDEQSLSQSLGYHIEKLINELLHPAQPSAKEFVTIGLSGGSLIKILSNILPYLALPWAKIRFFFADERFVPFSSDDSTYHSYDKLFRQLPLTEKNICKINPDVENVEQCAKDYETKLKELLKEPDQSFDILLLGMGPDGHTASLFPDHSALNVSDGLVTYVKNSPKPPTERVTLTLPTINKSKHVLICATGESKAQIVKEVIKDKSKQYPIGQVQGNNVSWYLDKQAASQL